MWCDDYFHYSDWEEMQKQVYDGFNLMPIPRKEGSFKFFYDRGSGKRVVPQGIFPLPNHKRVVLQPNIHDFTKALTEETEAGNDSLNMFEKEPYKMMVLKELQSVDSFQPISKDVSFVTNLQNFK